ncbi:24242_t:CDS:2, partial [Cetraspora pellucida]
PPVQALPIHLFNTNISQYSRSYNTSSVSLLDRYFFRPPESLFDKLKYTEYYEQYSLYPFKQQDIHEVSPGTGELFYLRCILMHRAVRTWDDIKIFNNIVYLTYQETAREMGLFGNENESIFAMKEAVESFSTPAQLRFLFTQLILDGAPALDIWQNFNSNLSDDIHSNNHNAINIALQQIASILAEHGRRLRDFGLPEPQTWTKE